MGSAIYQNKDRLFFHAVLNVQESSTLIEHYIKHPRREPDYRRGRRHGAFVTSLAEKGYDIQMNQIIEALKKEFVGNG